MVEKSFVAGPQVKFHTPAEMKLLPSEPGTFEGYAAVFGNVDSGGDVIEPGAFREYVRTKDGKVRILRGHNPNVPIGVGETMQDSNGLHIRGKLLIGNPMADDTYELMCGGVMDALSIGYDILPGGATYLNSGVRKLTGLKLYEVSVVTFGMNELARVEAVKAATLLSAQHPRDLEELLRERDGLSARKAKASANALWRILRGGDAVSSLEEEGADALMAAVREARRVTDLLKGK